MMTASSEQDRTANNGGIDSAALANRFDAVIADNPDRIAIRADGVALTYREFAAAVTAERARLKERPEWDPVLIRTPGSGESTGHLPALTTLIAVLTSRRVAVPVDGSLPERRQRMIVDLAAHGPLPNCAVLVTTSGSTGEPKAVRQGPEMWEHQIDEIASELGIGPDVTVLLALPASFGGGLDIALAALFTGATLIPGDPRRRGVDDLLGLLSDVAPDQLHLSPALMRTLTAHPAAAVALGGLDLVCTCGEAPDGSDVAALRTVSPGVTYVNRAGSSETGNLAWNRFPPGRTLPRGTVPPGRIASGKDIWAVDDLGVPLADGHAGRLRIASQWIARGYLVDGCALDFAAEGAGRQHELGDIGSVQDGCLSLAGRSDDAVKIRGYLVDLSEVVAALRGLPGIDDAVVVARRGATGAQELDAYAQIAPNGTPPSPNVLRGLLGERLPLWMQPTHIALMAELPRTERGKVDRTALPAPAVRPPYAALHSRTERMLGLLWEELLHVERIGADDDLLSLGCDSLGVAALTARIVETFDVGIQVSDVGAAPTLRDQAARIDAASSLPHGADVLTLSSAPRGCTPDDDRRPVVVAFTGAGESALAFVPLARLLPEYRVIGVQARGLERRAIPDYTVTAAARRAARHLTHAEPDGPLLFIGHSLGGVIAMETARTLAARGRVVDHVVCLDTVLSGPIGARSRVHLSPAAPVDHAPPAVRSRRDTSGLWKTRARLLSAGWWARPADEQWTLFYELGKRMALLHRLERYDGALTAVIADGNTDEEKWWSQLAPQCAEVRRVTGDHNAILRPPHVAETAAIVRAAFTASIGDRR